MKKIGLMMAATMAATMMGAAAHADTIHYTFSPDASWGSDYYGVTYNTSGSFDYDTTTGDVSNESIVWNGTYGTYNVDSATSPSPEQLDMNGGGADIDLVFANPLTAGGNDAIITSFVNGSPGNASGSVMSATAVSAAPEPGVWALMLAGVAMIGLTLRQGRRQRGMALAA